MTNTRRDGEERAQPDGVSPPTLARSLPRTSPAAALPADLPATCSPGTLVVSDLLDRAIQRIFTAGLLQSGAAQRSTPAVAASIEQAIVDLGDALRYIRADVLNASAMDPGSASLSEARPIP